MISSIVSGTKGFPSTARNLTELYQHTYRGNLALSSWLTLARTSLLSKNTETELAKNYRLIAFLNFMYKIYTSFLNSFLYDQCHCHKIITTEQAAEKKEYGDAENTC